mmetsp:Transcript_5752/g.6750  ORF Transcript_5752/g.6750 Transcript_5752/m.6750 type:complete len:81 (+) Transcript_5752:306-548(+)
MSVKDPRTFQLEAAMRPGDLTNRIVFLVVGIVMFVMAFLFMLRVITKSNGYQKLKHQKRVATLNGTVVDRKKLDTDFELE